jgi:hypothetical protein
MFADAGVSCFCLHPQARTFTILRDVTTVMHPRLLQRREEAPRIAPRTDRRPAHIRDRRPWNVLKGGVGSAECVSNPWRPKYGLAKGVFLRCEKPGCAMRGKSWIKVKVGGPATNFGFSVFLFFFFLVC